MSVPPTLGPVTGPSAWRGDELAAEGGWLWSLTAEQVAELEEAGRRFVAADPDLRTVEAGEHPLPACSDALRAWGREMDAGLGFVQVRGLPVDRCTDGLAGAIFFLLGLHLGHPVRQNVAGEILGHVKARDAAPDELVSSQTTDGLAFHSDSSDVVGLLCLRGAQQGGASRLLSGAAVYNAILDRRPDLAPLLFEPFHWNWASQDHDAPAHTYDSPICSWVDGVFSIYAGTSILYSAQDYPEVPRLRPEQLELLRLFDAVTAEPGMALDIEFQPGDIQWLLNAAVLHSRSSYVDHPDPARRRHLLRLWVRRPVGRPVVPRFGKHVVVPRSAPVTDPRTVHIERAVVPAWEAPAPTQPA